MHYKQYKRILSPKNGMNLYRGCTHGCIYCDSRSTCYQMNHDFEDIEVKQNAPQMLEIELRKKRKPCMVGTGAMSDPYIHLEEDLLITRQCLELIEQLGFGLAIQTKSTRLLRDLDILKKIHAKTKCVVQVTLTTYDDDLCSIIEPNVSTTSERVHMLNTLRDAGIPTVVWLSPILPFLNDTEENIKGLLKQCIEAKVYGILNFSMGVTMREGNRDYFYGKLDERFPGLKQRYTQTFGNSYVCNSPNHHKLMRILNNSCIKNGITCNMDEIFSYLHRFESNAQLTFFS